MLADAVFVRGGYAFAFGYGDCLAGRNVGYFVELAAGPADFDCVGFIVMA